MNETTSFETELLVIGAGPAGASLACFLSRYKLKGIMISAAPGTADTPRAHIHNMAAMECFRDIGLYEECLKLGNRGDAMKHYRWCETMAGEEYARNYSWGNGEWAGEYEVVSPCTHMDLPQSLLEPVLVRYAVQHGFQVRFDTQLLSFTTEGERTACLVKDSLTGMKYTIKTRFLFGADGGRSMVAKELALPMTMLPGGGLAFNILASADLSHIMTHRLGNLHWCLRLEKDYPFMAVCRMVKPWHEWMFVLFPKGPDAPVLERDDEEWSAIVTDLIGDKTVDVKILGVSQWLINETSADVISKGNVFCLGDAIHRHPPPLGMGSNTCIQDAFNLAWKIAFVLRGEASQELLKTYDIERQPVGARLVRAANDTLRKGIQVWQALGCAPYGSPEEERLKGRQELAEASGKGRARRQALKKSVEDMQIETHSLGVEFGQFYQSFAIYGKDEEESFRLQGRETLNPDQFYVPSTYPGRRLPHVWLGGKVPGPLVSTLDIAGKGSFTLFTGIGGDAWLSAAARVREEEDISIMATTIGRDLLWEDTYLDWERKRGVEDDGCVLVRPDLFVAWRALQGGDINSCFTRLRLVMSSILGIKN